jgi:hypothetical protein
MTNTFKLLRHLAKNKFINQINEMYKEPLKND